jgi:uncharacterized protein
MNNSLLLEVSPLSQFLSSDNKTIEIQIYRSIDMSIWVLEVVDEYNNSIVWEEEFETDTAALAEVNKIILEDGIISLIGPNFISDSDTL